MRYKSSFFLKNSYIFCFYPSQLDYAKIDILQKSPENGCVSLLSIYKTYLSMDMESLLQYLDHFPYWTIILRSDSEEDRLWFFSFMEKALPRKGFFSLFRQNLILLDLAQKIPENFREGCLPWIREIQHTRENKWVVQGSNL